MQKITSKPILISETAVGPQGDRLAQIPDLFSGVTQYKTLGLVWFDLSQDKGIYNEDWRIEGHQTAENAFSLGAAAMRLISP